jgi:hypothetical protein
MIMVAFEVNSQAQHITNVTWSKVPKLNFSSLCFIIFLDMIFMRKLCGANDEVTKSITKYVETCISFSRREVIVGKFINRERKGSYCCVSIKIYRFIRIIGIKPWCSNKEPSQRSVLESRQSLFWKTARDNKWR